MIKIWVKYSVTLDLDMEGQERVFPKSFYDSDPDQDGELIATDEEIRDWVWSDAGRAAIQNYFVNDVIAVTDEIHGEYIEVFME